MDVQSVLFVLEVILRLVWVVGLIFALCGIAYAEMLDARTLSEVRSFLEKHPSVSTPDYGLIQSRKNAAQDSLFWGLLPGIGRIAFWGRDAFVFVTMRGYGNGLNMVKDWLEFRIPDRLRAQL